MGDGCMTIIAGSALGAGARCTDCVINTLGRMKRGLLKTSVTSPPLQNGHGVGYHPGEGLEI